MAYLIEIPLLPFLGFPHTPFLTVITNIPLYRQSQTPRMAEPYGVSFLLFCKLALQPQLHLNMGNAVLQKFPRLLHKPVLLIQ
jgi:hypothetical protein